MWRRLFSAIKFQKKKPVGQKVDQSEKHSPKMIRDLNSFVFVRVVKLVIGALMVDSFIQKERKIIKLNKEKQFIIFGKRGSGVHIVGNALLGTGNNDVNRFDREPNIAKNFKRDILHSGIEEVEALNDKFQRTVKIKYLYLDDETSLSANALSPLLISGDYTVIYCFPISHRFTTEDWNLLQRYLPYRDRTDFQRTTVAFTYSDRLEDDTKSYIETLPAQLKNFISDVCGNKYIFISSSKDASSENESSVESMIKPIPMENLGKKLLYANVLFSADPVLTRLFTM